jgi:hypothetical protein
VKLREAVEILVQDFSMYPGTGLSMPSSSVEQLVLATAEPSLPSLVLAPDDGPVAMKTSTDLILRVVAGATRLAAEEVFLSPQVETCRYWAIAAGSRTGHLSFRDTSNCVMLLKERPPAIGLIACSLWCAAVGFKRRETFATNSATNLPVLK